MIKEEKKEYQNKYNKKNRLKINAYYRSYYEKNHKKLRDYQNKYYSKKKFESLSLEDKIKLETKKAISNLPEQERIKLRAKINNIKTKESYKIKALNMSEKERAKRNKESSKRYIEKYHSDPEFREKRLKYQAEWRKKNKKVKSYYKNKKS